MNKKEQERIRTLAKQQMEIAQSNKMQELEKEWRAHNAHRGQRPMITVELGTFEDDVIPDLMQCESEEGRNIEKALLENIVNHQLFGDDTFVNPYFSVQFASRIKPFDITVEIEHAQGSLGHHFQSVIEDLGEDFHKLKKSTYHFVEKEKTFEKMNTINELIGDILPAKLVGSSLYACPTQDIVHLMSMENLFISMYDYPDLFKQMLDNLTDDYVQYFRLLEKENRLLSTVDSQRVGQGTYCFTEELPTQKNTSFLSTDVWGYMDSQETVGVSPEMYEEFVFPAYKKLAVQYGLLSYGCCEPVHSLWENCLSTLPNLRKLSISPWCDESYMGERLADKKIIYHRKPNPNFLGVGTVFDEVSFREHITKTLKLARGCKIEFTQRDVYTINKDISKVKRFVEIIREESVKHYR